MKGNKRSIHESEILSLDGFVIGNGKAVLEISGEHQRYSFQLSPSDIQSLIRLAEHLKEKSTHEPTRQDPM